MRSETKFHRLYEFGKLLPLLRRQVENDLRLKDLVRKKVLATVIRIMEYTYIRIGNTDYEKLYGSYGLTTMQDRHVHINGDHIRFSFRGKKGIYHNVQMKSKRLARVVRQCRDIPGRELFQYYDRESKRKVIESSMVNEYIRSIMGPDFSAKYFRTWAGSVHAFNCLCNMPPAESVSGRRKNIATMLETVSKMLGNSKAICKKYYIHPDLIQQYEENHSTYFKQPDINEVDDQKNKGLSILEKRLLKILKDH